MGIGGSGMSAAAALAKAAGFDVDGCDININTPYVEKLKKDVSIHSGHSPKHLKDTDLLVVTPAVYFDEPRPDELVEAKKAMAWQAFMGQELQNEKEVICVAGTHGKSTTTAMLSLVFEAAKLDPTVMIGATVRNWGANFRIGKSDKFIVESDEFFDSFLNYSPNVIVLNNIEFDHPDYFNSEEQLIESFTKHINSLVGKRVLIANIDSPKAASLIKEIDGLNIITYSLIDQTADYCARVIERTEEGSKFELNSDTYELSLSGDFNVSNALGVIAVSKLYGIPITTIKNTLKTFSGIGRRMEYLGEKDGVKIYDDYAHHPTAIRETLLALRQKHPSQKIFAIIEPHSYSRTKALLDQYKNAFVQADDVIIAPIFKARDTETFGVNEDSIVEASGHKTARTLGSFDEITKYISTNAKPKDVVIVMGAGKSYELSRKLLS